MVVSLCQILDIANESLKVQVFSGEYIFVLETSKNVTLSSIV